MKNRVAAVREPVGPARLRAARSPAAPDYRAPRPLPVTCITAMPATEPRIA